MARFYFDIADNEKEYADSEGTDLGSIEEAREEALKSLGERARDQLPDGDHRVFAITVRQEDRTPLLRATLELRVERVDAGRLHPPRLDP